MSTLERRIELVGGAHLAPHQLGRVVHLPRRALEEQLVVDLQDEAGRGAGLAQGDLTAHHRHLDDVRGGALDHRVDRQPLAELPRVGVARAQLGIERRRPISVRT